MWNKITLPPCSSQPPVRLLLKKTLKQFNEKRKAQADYDAIVKQVSELVQAHIQKLMQRQQQSENGLEQVRLHATHKFMSDC